MGNGKLVAEGLRGIQSGDVIEMGSSALIDRKSALLSFRVTTGFATPDSAADVSMDLALALPLPRADAVLWPAQASPRTLWHVSSSTFAMSEQLRCDKTSIC